MEPTNRWQMSSDEESDGIAALCGAPDSQASIRSASPPLHPIKPGAPLVFRPIASALRARMQQDIKEQPSAGAVVEPLQQAPADVALATSDSDAETIPWCVNDPADQPRWDMSDSDTEQQQKVADDACKNSVRDASLSHARQVQEDAQLSAGSGSKTTKRSHDDEDVDLCVRANKKRHVDDDRVFDLLFRSFYRVMCCMRSSLVCMVLSPPRPIDPIHALGPCPYPFPNDGVGRWGLGRQVFEELRVVAR
jgi:hypothetical protein